MTSVRHRHGCPEPGWLVGAVVAGVRVLRCADCGCVQLVPVDDAATARRTP